MPGPLAMAGIGAGMGALSHLFGGGGGGPTTQRTTYGADDNRFLDFRRAFAENIFGRGMPDLDPSIMAAMQGYGGYADAGRFGLDALTDPSKMRQLQAYETSAMNPIFDWQRRQLENQHRQQMTRMGAFGVRGSVMGPDFGSIDRNQLQFGLGTIDRANNLALQMANYGQFGIGGMHNLGQWITNRPMEWGSVGSNALAQAYGGPKETIQTTDDPNQPGNLGQAMIGGAMAGLSLARRPRAPSPVSPIMVPPVSYGGNPNSPYAGAWGFEDEFANSNPWGY